MEDTNTVKGSQFKQPLLEFSGSCAGCAETAYARLVTQVCGDRMYISNATGCSSIWGGPAATSPYTVNKEGKGSRLGQLPCSRITPSTALACTWARRPSAAAWPTRPAPCWPWSGALQP